MRAFEYYMELGRWGYRISNGKTITSYDNPGSEVNAKSRGIKMTVEKCSNLEHFNRLFHVCQSANRKDDSFMSHWQDAVLGKDGLWKLVNVWVRGHELMLDYINEALYGEYIDALENDVDEEEYDCTNDETMPPYYARLECYGTSFPEIQLCFETFSDNGDKDSITHVNIFSDGFISLTEINGRQERRFDFQNESWEDASTPVRIVECNW